MDKEIFEPIEGIAVDGENICCLDDRIKEFWNDIKYISEKIKNMPQELIDNQEEFNQAFAAVECFEKWDRDYNRFNHTIKPATKILNRTFKDAYDYYCRLERRINNLKEEKDV